MSEIQRKDTRIVLIDKQNEGVELARQTGVNHAKGSYITYLDSDDWFFANALEQMYEAALYSDSDIVVAKVIRVMDRFGFIKKLIFNPI